jgi:CRISPR-associated protein Cmr6
MGLYPFYNALQDESKVLLNGNFGLWYNKYIPLSHAFKASDDRGNDTRAAEFYFERYGQIKKGNVAELLKQKHNDQRAYCGYFPSENYESIQIEAILESPLLTASANRTQMKSAWYSIIIWEFLMSQHPA